MEPGGDGGSPLDGDGGAPALVEVADGEDAVLVAGLGEGVLDFLEEFRQAGRRDRGDRLAQGRERRGGHGNQRLVTFAVDWFVDRVTWANGAVRAIGGTTLWHPCR